MHPFLVSLFQAARDIWHERADLRSRFGSAESLGYWNWLVVDGWDEYPELRECLPVPPASLMGNVIGAGADERAFVTSGASDAHNLFECLHESLDLAAGGRILDFGCGCGRILRIMARLADEWSFSGVDVDRAAVEWCEAHLPFADYHVIAPRPPLPWDDREFRAGYAYSVFSHLEEKLHAQWLAELSRVTAEGGVLVLTVAGEHCFERIRSGNAPEAVGGVTPEQLDRDQAELRRAGYVYYPYESPVSLPEDERDSGVYGMTFITRDYVCERWPDFGFEVIDYKEAPQDWQDYVVLRRRG